MPVGIALIRGINVGGNRKLPMETLRDICEGVGLRDSRTLIQSGNVVFRCTPKAMSGAASLLATAIDQQCGFRPEVLVRSVRELRALCASRIFEDHNALEPSRLIVMFLPEAPSAAAIKSLRRFVDDGACAERFALAGREVFLYFPNGIANSGLPMAKVEKLMGTPGTCRNWNTVNKLLGMAEELGDSA